jgi:hypothetical protein
MSGHPHTIHLPPAERLVPSKYALTNWFAFFAVAGIILTVIGALLNHVQFAYSWFFALYYFISIALGSFFWVTLHYASNAGWSVLVRRVWENILALFPLLFVLFTPLLLPGISDVLWKYMTPDNQAHLNHAKDWFSRECFVTKWALYCLYFCLAGAYYRRQSIAQDTDGSPVRTRNMIDHSYLALVIFGVLETFLSFDWFMGLAWPWSSSLFGAYNFGLCVQAGMAACIVLVAIFRSAGFLSSLNSEHFYLMGKLLFGFSILWAYFAFGQYLLIWYANIPEETVFYNDHSNAHGWRALCFLIVVGKFMFPVMYLLAQDTKKSLRSLTAIAIWLLFMHGVELYWFIMPYAHPATILPNWQDLVSFITVTSILGFAYIRFTAGASLIPVRDPRMVESLTVTN